MKFWPTLCTTAALSIFQPLAAAETSAELDKESQKALLAAAKQWDIPQPKPESNLIKIWVYKSGGGDFYALGFCEEADAKQALVGFNHWDITRGTEVKKVADQENFSLKDVSPTSPFSEVNGVNFGLITGIQLLRAGHSKMGQALINKALKDEAGHPHSAFKSPAGEAPVVMLARSCLANALNSITSQKPDFAAIKQRIETILDDQPKLKSDATAWVLKGLEANAQHQPAAPGTIDALIDEYMLSGVVVGAMNPRSDKFVGAERALILKGFEAVPALIARLDCKRFTNHLMQGFNNFVSHPMSEGQVINVYLQRLANDEFGSNWLVRQQGGTSEKDAVMAWWAKATKTGEKDYVKDHTIVAQKKREVQVSHELLLIATERYPDLLPGLYRKMLKSSTASWPVAEALMGSNTPMELKLELLQAGIATNEQAHRNTALAYLQDLRADLTDEHLVRLLKKAPKTTKGEYWTDQDAGLTRLVSKSKNENVWRELHTLLKLADLGMQMELIDNLNPPMNAPPQILQSYHEIYKQFCADTRIRDESTSDKFSGPGAGFPHDRLAMRDYIHMHWARWLKLEQSSPEEKSTPQQWEAFRNAVSKAVEKTATAKGLSK